MTLVATEPAGLDVTIDREAILSYLGLDPRKPATQALILVCERYGLDPVLKHMVLINGNPYITRDGYLTIAHRSGVFDGLEVLDTGADQTHYWAKVAVYRKDMSRPFTFVGRYPKSGGNAAYRPEMAIKTAEVAGLRRAFNVTGVGAADEVWDQTTDYAEPVNGTSRMIDGVVLASAEQVARIDELLPLVADEDVDELKAWKAAEQITMKSGEFTAEAADRVIAKLEDLARGGPSDGAPAGAVATPSPVSSSGDTAEGTTGSPTPSPSVPAGDVGGGEPATPPAASPDTSEPGGEDTTDGSESVTSRVAPSGPDLETALIAAIDQARSIPQAKAAVVRHAAAKHGHGGTFADLLADVDLAERVLAELGGTVQPTGEGPVPWKETNFKAWDTWRKRCNAKAGPGTKADPHPRLLDEDPEIYDEQRHAIAFQASRRHRGPGREVTSWADLTEAECVLVEQGLDGLANGTAILTFGDTGSPGGWVIEAKAAA